MQSRYYNLETKKTHDGRTVYRPKLNWVIEWIHWHSNIIKTQRVGGL